MENNNAWINKEDICEESIKLIAETFDSFGIWFFVRDFEGHEILTVPLNAANTPVLEMQFVVDENPNSVLSYSTIKARVYGLYPIVPYDYLGRVYNTINQWSGRSHFMSFHIDADQELYMKYDFPSSCSKNEVLGRMALEVWADTRQFLMENYCTLLNILNDDNDGEFVPQDKWEEYNGSLKHTCTKTYPFEWDTRANRLDEIYGSMEYQCWVPFEEET